MAKRINVILPERTLETIDRLVKPGQRSHLIDKAVQHYVATRSPEGLREQLKVSTIRDRDLDREVMTDWAAVENESWQHLEEEAKRKPGRTAATSTSRRSIRR